VFIQQRQALLSAVVSVCAVWVLGCLDNSLSSALSEEFVLDAPIDISATALSSSDINVGWRQVSGAMGYRVYRSTSASGAYGLVWSGASPASSSYMSISYIDNNLLPDTTYYYTVSACNGVGESSKSRYCPATTILNAPTNISANVLSSSSVTVSWSSVSGATGYRVYRSTSFSGSYFQVGNGTSSTSYTDNNVSPGTTYYYTVSAYNSNVESSRSSSISATTIPNAPSGVSASSSSSSSVTVNWPSVNGAAGYRVYRSMSVSGSYSQVGTTSSSYTSYTDNNVSPGTTYYYKVSAYNNTGESLQSSYASATTILNAPTSVTASSSSSSSVTVSWSSVSGATGYRVYRSTSSSDYYYEVTTTYSTSYTDVGLSSGTNYYYKVSAYNSTVESSQSSYASATTILNAPSNVSASSSSSSSVIVSWSSVNGATGYRVYRSTSSSGSYYEVTTTYSTSYTDVGLSSGTNYYYKVSSYNGTVESSQSSYASATTILNAPSNVSASSSSSSGVTVSWSAVNGATGYRVYRSTSSSGNYYEVGNGTSSTSYTDNSVSPGTTYYYKVSAYNSTVESSQSSYASAMTSVPAPATPTNVSAHATSSSGVTVSWSAVSGATEYRVYRSMSATGSYSLMVTTSYASYTNNSLLPNTTYYYKVSALNSAGESSLSIYASATTPADDVSDDD